jgi:hypothetical protein
VRHGTAAGRVKYDQGLSVGLGLLSTLERPAGRLVSSLRSYRFRSEPPDRAHPRGGAARGAQDSRVRETATHTSCGPVHPADSIELLVARTHRESRSDDRDRRTRTENAAAEVAETEPDEGAETWPRRRPSPRNPLAARALCGGVRFVGGRPVHLGQSLPLLSPLRQHFGRVFGGNQCLRAKRQNGFPPCSREELIPSTGQATDG